LYKEQKGYWHGQESIMKKMLLISWTIGDFARPIEVMLHHDDDLLQSISLMIDHDLDIIPVLRDDHIAGILTMLDVLQEITKLLI
jgi:predicted transcriptional regulator